MPVFILSGVTFDMADSSVDLGVCITADGCVGYEGTSRTAKARLAFANLRHFWRRHDIQLSLKGRIYSATVRAVLLYGCETWPVRAEDAHRLSVFEHRCLRSIAHIWWRHHVSNEDVRRRVLGSDSRPLPELISLHRLRWFGHVLRMPTHRLPQRALLSLPGRGWNKQRGGQPMTWRRGVKKVTSLLGRVGSSRLPGWQTMRTDG